MSPIASVPRRIYRVLFGGVAGNAQFTLRDSLPFATCGKRYSGNWIHQLLTNELTESSRGVVERESPLERFSVVGSGFWTGSIAESGFS
jgi:hypothetical protein